MEVREDGKTKKTDLYVTDVLTKNDGYGYSL